jgi:hypothetical protein
VLLLLLSWPPAVLLLRCLLLLCWLLLLTLFWLTCVALIAIRVACAFLRLDGLRCSRHQWHQHCLQCVCMHLAAACVQGNQGTVS